ncbi:transglycosylase domain-containing protein [Sphingobacterium faecium]|uniref:transglycosylase domain-containing protein n=1 Tax=Sphingobacterium faecium TaxID=34087 RepID=UPI003DA238D1
MLTLYLNIIEFGPDIYGIHQACNFYFSKCPNELTIEHCLVLCYIIPRPIFFYEALMEDSVILQHNIKKFTHELLAVISS